MEAEISNALNSSSLTNQTAPTTTINERQTAGNDIDTLNLSMDPILIPLPIILVAGRWTTLLLCNKILH